MGKQNRTALGKSIDMDNLRLMNEDTIAVGNMRVNARGDELGPGGAVVKTRNQVMDEYYRLNTPTPVDTAIAPIDRPRQSRPMQVDVGHAAEPVSPAQAATLKGSLANSFMKK